MQAGETVEPAFEIEDAAIRLLAQREHSRRELDRKLARRFDRPEQVASVLDDLERRDLVSDRRFTEQYVDQRIARGYGPLRIRGELCERGVDSELIGANLDLGRDEWMSHLREAAASRFGAQPPRDRAVQAKCARFLHYRGFPDSLIRDYLWD